MEIYHLVALLLWISSTTRVIAMDPNRVSSKNETSTSRSIATGKRKREVICTTDSCNYFAQTFLTKLNPEIEPCDDFHEFVCRKNVESIYTMVQNSIDQRIMSLLTNSEQSENLSRLRKLYHSCNIPNPNNFNTLLGLIKSLNGFPLGGDKSGWNKMVPFDWIQTTARYRQIGLPLDQFMSLDVKSVNQINRLFISPQPQLLSNFVLDESLYADLTRLLYPDRAFLVRRQLSQLMKFRKSYIKIMRGVNTNIMHHRSLASLQLEVPGINWHQLVQGLLLEDNVDDEYMVVIYEYDKIKSIAKLISKTRPESLANHMMLTVIETFAPYVTVPGSGLELMDDHPRPDCKEILSDELGIALSIEYSKQQADRESTDVILDIISSLRTEIKLMVDEADWISNDVTRSRAKDKIDSMTFEVGIAERLLDFRTSEWYYRGLELTDEDMIGNFLSIKKVKYDRKFVDMIDQPSETFEWVDYDRYPSAQTDAVYWPEYNRVRILEGYMSRMFVDSSRLGSINFALLGSTIAHEIMHAFDLSSIKLDSNKQRVDWWDSESMKQYKLKAKCLKRQYHGLKLDGSNWSVDGQRTLCENIADNAGVEVAYRAFRRWLKAHEHRPALLNGIKLDAEQLFWASYAIDGCNHSLLEINAHQLDMHSPPKFRINIPLSNYEEFSHDFNCRLDSNMNPRDKCIIW